MSRIAVIDARKDLADILNRAAYGKERVVLTRRGKDVAAIVPIDDLNILEAIEDHMDLTESKEILDRARAGSEQLLSLDEVKAKYEVPRSRAATSAKKPPKRKR
jgi:prevent-host-death family protein